MVLEITVGDTTLGRMREMNYNHDGEPRNYYIRVPTFSSFGMGIGISLYINKLRTVFPDVLYMYNEHGKIYKRKVDGENQGKFENDFFFFLYKKI